MAARIAAVSKGKTLAIPMTSAVGSFRGLPIDDGDALQDVQVAVPDLRPHDVLVRVMAVSVNPADVKERAALAPSDTPRVLGYDAAGVIEAVGSAVSTLSAGEEVWYAGDVQRQGSNAELHAVDERIVARKPTSLSFGEAAAMPLTTITAWETLFERFGLTEKSSGDLLILGAAGGVGSMMIQLAKTLTDVRVIATASREESRAWARDLGADAVIDHHDLRAQALAAAPDGIDYLFSPHSRGNVETFAAIMRPFGHITAIDEPAGLDLLPLKEKSIAWHWELMFTRALFGADLIAQQHLLTRAAHLVDSGALRSTVTTSISSFDAAGLRQAHRAVESGTTIGKVVVHRAENVRAKLADGYSCDGGCKTPSRRQGGAAQTSRGRLVAWWLRYLGGRREKRPVIGRRYGAQTIGLSRPAPSLQCP